MLGLGWTEMLVVGIVALVVIGPKDLPVVMHRIGKFAGQIRRMGNEFQREINRTTGLDEVRNLRNSIAAPLKKTADELRRELNTVTPKGDKPSVPAPVPVQATPTPSADEKAAEYGFKPTTPKTSEPVGEPVASDVAKPTRVKAAPRAKAAPTKAVTAAELPPITSTSDAVVPPDAAPKRARRIAVVEDPETAAPAAARKRAPRKRVVAATASPETVPAQSEPGTPKRRRASKTVVADDAADGSA